MPSDLNQIRASLPLKLAAIGGLLFLHLPILLIFLYAFTTEEKSYAFPPPGLTLEWFGVAWNRADIWPPLWLSLQVAGLATLIAMVLGTLVAAAMAQSRFFGRDQISLLILLPNPQPQVVVPESAITYTLYGNSVYVASPKKDKDGKPEYDDKGQPQLVAEQRTVKTGERRDGVVVVSEGLQAGEQVVTAGQLKLTPGAAIRIGQDNALKPEPGAAAKD